MRRRSTPERTSPPAVNGFPPFLRKQGGTSTNGEFHMQRKHLIVAIAAGLFGLMTIVSGGLVLFGPPEAQAADA